MLLSVLKSKIAHATVTECELYYEGSVTIAEDIMQAAGLVPGEKVAIFNANNGARLETYVIAGKVGSAQICLNGPAARQGCVGDKLIIVSYGLVTPEEAKDTKVRTVYLDHGNTIKT